MRPFDDDTVPAWADERLEAYLDGALPSDEAARLEVLLAQETDVEADLLMARRIREGLRTLPRPACPPTVALAVKAAARRDARPALGARLAERLGASWRPIWQPALAVAVLAALVFSSTLVGRLPAPGPAPQPVSSAAVDDALAQAKWTLAFLSEVGRETGRTVRRDVLDARVVDPMRQALETITEPPPNTRN